MVSLTIRTKSSERCDVDHVGMSGNLCKTTIPGANESDFCHKIAGTGVVAVQTDEHQVLAVKVAWASAGCESQPASNAHA